jgi:amino acid transporter
MSSTIVTFASVATFGVLVCCGAGMLILKKKKKKKEEVKKREELYLNASMESMPETVNY